MPKQALDIHDLSHDGRGVGRDASGKTCFVTGALPGEQVLWSQQNSKRSFNEGICTEVLQPSPDRVEPQCQYFTECGGCELQHFDARAQLDWKERQLQSMFAKADMAPEHWMPSLHSDNWNYRRRTRLAVTFAKGDRVFLGFRSRGSRKIVDVDHCDVLEGRLNSLLPDLKAVALKLKNKGLSELELSAGDTHLAVCFNLKFALGEEDIEAIRAGFPGLKIWQKLPGKSASSVNDTGALRALISEGTQMDFHPGQFIQINNAMNQAMIAQALEWLDPKTDQSLLDLFCGSGNFSLAFARRVKSVMGAEGSDELCAQARHNAQINALTNLEFKTVNLFEPAQFARLGKNKFDQVLLDPPRAGAAAIMPWLKKSGAEKILYISCHPATMVRDIQMLPSAYRIEKVGAMNMFPHTTHLEAMALLIRR